MSSHPPSPPAPTAVRLRARATWLAAETLTHVPGSSFVLPGQPLPWRADAPRRPHEVPRAPSVSGFRGFHDESCAGVVPAGGRLPHPSARQPCGLCPACAGPSVAGPHTCRPLPGRPFRPLVTPSWLCMSSSSENTSQAAWLSPGAVRSVWSCACLAVGPFSGDSLCAP